MTYELLAAADAVVLAAVLALLRQHPHYEELLSALDADLDETGPHRGDRCRPAGWRSRRRRDLRTHRPRCQDGLHWLWDGMLVDSDEYGAALDRSAVRLGAHSAAALEQAPANGPVDFPTWAEERTRIAVASGYLDGMLGTGTAEEACCFPPYVQASRPVAERRAVIAAHRLARLLAELF